MTSSIKAVRLPNGKLRITEGRMRARTCINLGLPFTVELPDGSTLTIEGKIKVTDRKAVRA